MPEITVEIRRSRRRKRTVTAFREAGKVVVCMPATFTKAQEQQWVSTMLKRLDAADARRRDHGGHRPHGATATATALANLLHNARIHAPGAQVTVRAEQRHATVVLVVDDEASNLASLQKIFEREQMRVFVADGAKAALDLVRTLQWRVAPGHAPRPHILPGKGADRRRARGGAVGRGPRGRAGLSGPRGAAAARGSCGSFWKPGGRYSADTFGMPISP